MRYAEGLWRMRRHGPVIAHCTDSEDFPLILTLTLTMTLTLPEPDARPEPNPNLTLNLTEPQDPRNGGPPEWRAVTELARVL